MSDTQPAPVNTREIKLWIALLVAAIIVGLLIFFLIRQPAAARSEARTIALIKTNMMIRDRLVYITNEVKTLNAEDSHEKIILSDIGSLTNDRLVDPIKLFYAVQSNQ